MMTLNEENAQLDDEDRQLLNQIRKIPGFENIEPTEEGLDKLDERITGLEEVFQELDQDAILDKIQVKVKVHDLTREVTITLQAKDDATFKVMQRLAPFVELFPILAKAGALPL